MKLRKSKYQIRCKHITHLSNDLHAVSGFTNMEHTRFNGVQS